jgi:hypothetical protein
VSKPRTLIITGAGASTQLGRNGEAMPQMAGWAERLRHEIGHNLTVMTTLDQADDGPSFEATLGALFRFAESLPDVDSFAAMARQPPGHDQTWEAHLHQAAVHVRQNLAEFMGHLHRSLFDNFGPAQIDDGKAHAAYAALFARLGIDAARDELILATTNYDRSIERSFFVEGLPLRTGFVADGVNAPTLTAADLGTFSAGRPAAIYLHGAVGWYRHGDDIISMPANLGYQQAQGDPAVLYPGPDKDVGRIQTKELWDEFVGAVASADRILVLGHSLHDDHLVDALATASAPLAVTYFSQQAPIAPSTAQAERNEERIANCLPQATLVAATFGPEPSFDDPALKRWVDAGKQHAASRGH